MSHYRTMFSTSTPLPHPRAQRYRQENRTQSMTCNPHVLFVSEDEKTASHLGTFLSKSGFDAVVACDGVGALKLAGAYRFDMLVTDVEMSPVDGVRVATAFRNINPASQVFLVTSDYEGARQLLIDANLAWDFRILLKPIEPQQLVEALHRTWSHEARLRD